jgi:spore coat protein CotH
VRNGVFSCNRLALSLVRLTGIAALTCQTACARPFDDATSQLSKPDTETSRNIHNKDATRADEGAAGSASNGAANEVQNAAPSPAAKQTAPSKGQAPSTAAKAATPSAMLPMADAAPSGGDSGAPNPADAAAGTGAAPSGETSPAEPADPIPSAPVQCQPKAGRYSVLEGDKLTVNLSCSIDGAVPSTWAIGNLPTGAALDAATGTLTWRPGLNQAASYKLTAQALPWAEATTLDIAVIDRWDADGNVPLVDPSTYHEEYGLPVLHLNTDPGVNDDAYTPATITYRGHTYAAAEAKYRGATSKSYPKRSFTLKFTKQDKFSDPDRAGGFLEKRKLTLITSFDDNSHLRQRLGYELWNRMDPTGHIRVQSYNVVVYLNGEYHGLYTLADHVDGFLMEDFGYNQEGNLYKARSYDANFRSSSGVAFTPEGMALPKETLHDGFTKEEGTPEEGQPGAFDDLDALVSWASSSSDADFARTIDSTIARKEYEDWWIWVSYIRADDSAGKNSYHYHDPLGADSLWHCVPWDLNASFGQDWKTFRSPADTSPPDAWFRSVNNLFDRILSDATMGPALEQRYGVELKGPLAGDTVIELFDGMASEIEQSALRDEQKWQSAYRAYMLWKDRTDFTSYQQEVEYVRRWISVRHAYLEDLY